MQKKGFTLIELLAVIVILAVIALISVPIILGVVEDSKINAFRSSVRNIFHAVELEVSKDGGKTSGSVLDLKFEKGSFSKGSWIFNQATNEIVLTKIISKDGNLCVQKLDRKTYNEKFAVSTDCENVIKIELPVNASIVGGNDYDLKVAKVTDTKGYKYNYGTINDKNTIIVNIADKVLTVEELSSYVKTLAKGTYDVRYLAKDQNGNEEIAILVLEITAPYLVDVVKIGDYVAYTPDDGAKAALANNTGGWRVIGKTGSGSTGTVRLITTGAPESAYYPYNNASQLSANMRVQYPGYKSELYSSVIRTINVNDLYATGIPTGKLCCSGCGYTSGWTDLTKLSREYVIGDGTGYDACIAFNGWGKLTTAPATFTFRIVSELKTEVKTPEGDGQKESPFKLEI